MTGCWGSEHVEELSTALIVLVEGPAASALHAKKILPKFCQVVDQHSKNKNKNCPSVCVCAWRKKICVCVSTPLSGEVLQPGDSSHYLGQCNSVFIVCHFSIMEIRLREKWVAGFASVGEEKKILHPFSPLVLLNWNPSLAYGCFNFCSDMNISAEENYNHSVPLMYCPVEPQDYSSFLFYPTARNTSARIKMLIMSHPQLFGPGCFTASLLCAGRPGMCLCSRVRKVSQWRNLCQRDSWFSSWSSPRARPTLFPSAWPLHKEPGVDHNSASHASAFYVKYVRFFPVSQFPGSVEQQRCSFCSLSIVTLGKALCQAYLWNSLSFS